MPHLAALCETCRKVVIIAAPLFGEFTCRVCSGAVRIVPSCGYSAADAVLFEELSEAVQEGKVTAPEAHGLAGLTANALWSGSYFLSFETLTARLPGLMPFQLVIGKNASAQRRALTMLKTIFDALCLSQRSGPVAALALPWPPRLPKHSA